MHEKTIARILKVNHAGECGAIRIYSAQKLIAGWLCPELLAFFEETIEHEKEHCRLFLELMPARKARPCRAMWLWGVGGWLLGSLTALAGRRAIMICTYAVESTVHQHLQEQLAYLHLRDAELFAAIKAIQTQELMHLDFALNHLPAEHRSTVLFRLVNGIICKATDAVIWLSTQGDVSRMVKDIRS